MSSANANNTKTDKMKVAPFRSLSEFLLDSKGYLPPAFNDMKRFNNRVTSNLLYFQTNYFTISVIVFIIASLFGFGRLLAGIFGLGSSAVLLLFAIGRLPGFASDAMNIRANYPYTQYIAFALKLVIIYMTFRSIAILLLVVLIPIAFSLLHASMRSRGIKNKLSNKMEQLGAEIYSDTPMGFILTSLGLEARSLED